VPLPLLAAGYAGYLSNARYGMPSVYSGDSYTARARLLSLQRVAR
jgi:hypothetical protein